MKKTIYLISIFILIFNSYIEDFFIKNRIIKDLLISSKKEINKDLSEKFFVGKIIRNGWTKIWIDKGEKDGIKKNTCVFGEKGFIGIIYKVKKNYSVIKTFWYNNWKLIIIDGNNNYSFLKSNGYYLSLESKFCFSPKSILYILFNKKLFPIGICDKKNKFFPFENLLEISYVYFSK